MVSVGKKPVRRGSRDQLEVDGRASQWQPAALQERNDPQDPSAGDYLHAVTQADPSSTNTSTSNAEEADSQLGDKSIAPSSTWTAGETSLADSQSPLVRIASDTKDSQQGEQAAESPSLGRIPSIMQVGHIDGKADTDKKDTHTHTIEISAGTAEHEHAVDTQKKASFMARLHLPHRQQGKKRRQRRLLREPITTITSSLGRKRTANTAGAHTNGTGTSSAAGLLAVSGSADRSSSFKSDATGHSLSESTSKASDTSPPHSPAVDAEIGINDVRGTNGILKRVHDSWSLIGLTLANIGPVAGQLPPQRSRLLEELLTENSDIKPSQANQYDDDIQTDIPDLLGAFFGVHTAKEYGGYSMLAIGWPLSGLCMCLFSAVLAELSSSYPVAGAMFTWTFRTCRLSPTLRPFARYLSWICGSLLLCGHILAQMLLEFQIATVLQGLIVIFAQDYVPTTWRTILLAWACLLVSASLAVHRFGRSPWLWKGFSILVFAVVLILVVSVFACSSYRNSASFIFTSYRNETGWTSKGYVYLLGWVLTSIATGQDVAAHLAEEAKNPTTSVPMGVFWGTAISYLIGWIVMLCIMAVTPETPHGPTPTRDYGAPAQMLTEILPRPLAFTILLLIVILMVLQDTAQLLASSRFMWALARDSAIPFSPYLRRLSAGTQLPIRATWTVCAIAAPCLLLIAGSRQIVTSLILSGCGSSLVLAYLMPVVCYLCCPKGGLDIDGRNAWTLRGASRFAAGLGSCYVLLIVVMMCCPNFYPVTSTSFSYAAPVIAFVLLLSSLTWIFYGNSHYAGPIKSITVYTVGREVELPKLTGSMSTNRQTPHSGRPTDPQGLRGFSGPAATTGIEIGKTANLFSDSLATVDLRRPMETVDISQSMATQSWRSSELGNRAEAAQSGATDTQGTEYTEYSTDGSYTDSDSEGESGSEGGDGSVSHRAEAVQSRIPRPTVRPTR